MPGRLGRDPVDDLAPELLRHPPVELRGRERVLGTGRDRPAGAGLGIPEPADVPAREDHRGVEPEDRRAARDVEDRLDDRLADLGVEVVELGRVVPRVRRAVVAVVDEPLLVALRVPPAEDHRRVGAVPVVVLDLDVDPAVLRQVRAGERVRGERRVGQRDEPIGVLDDPARVDAHVVRDHVRRDRMPRSHARRLQVLERGLAAELVGDPVLVDRVGGRDRVGVAAPALDLRGGAAALPQPDQPQPGDPELGQAVELLVRHVGEGRHGPPVARRELLEPDVRRLGHEHDARHPLGVLREADGVRVEPAVVRRLDDDRAAEVVAGALQLERARLLGEDVEREVDPAGERGIAVG